MFIRDHDLFPQNEKSDIIILHYECIYYNHANGRLMNSDFSTGFRLIGTTFKLWWSDWVNQVIVCLVAVIVSLTIILLPPSLMGIYQQAQDLSRGNRTGIIGWWNGFKKYLWISLLWGFASTLILLILSFNVWFYYHLKTSWGPVLVVFFIIAIVIWIIFQFYSLGYFFEQKDKTIKLAWKNGLLTILAAPAYTLIIGFATVIMVVVSLGTFIPLLIGSPSLLALLSVSAVRNRLIKYQKIPDDN